MVIGSYIVQALENEPMQFRVKQRFTCCFKPGDVYHIHLSNPDYTLESNGQNFPFKLVREMRELMNRCKDHVVREAMTGLLNRNFLQEQYDALHQAFKALGGCVLYLDFNGLKLVNDTYGHDHGDALIAAFAKCLREAVEEAGSEAQLLRAGGDELIMQAAGEDSTRCRQILKAAEDAEE